MSINTKNILDCYFPPIASSPEISIPLSIILNEKEGWLWFHNNYILLKAFYKKKEDIHITFVCDDYSKKCPLIIENHIDRKLFSELGNTKDLIQIMIDNNCFLKFFIDRYYFSENYSEKNHTIHDVMLYGYDNKKNLYHIADYFQLSKFDFKGVDQDKFIKSYNSYSSNHIPIWLDPYYSGNMYTLKYKKCDYKFNLDFFLKSIEDYYNSKYTTDNFNNILEIQNEDVVYGLEIYELFIDYIERVMKNKIKKQEKKFHVLYDQKVAMCLHLEFLIKNKYLNDNCDILSSYTKIKEDALSIRNLFIKFLIVGDQKLLEKIISLLIRIKEDDKQSLKKIMDCLS